MLQDRRTGRDDRRFLERVRLACAVRESAPGHLRLGQATDISLGGMRFVGAGDAPPRAVTVTFELPGWGALVRADAEVVSPGAVTSIRFTGLRSVDERLISLYVAGAPDRDPRASFRVVLGRR
jgi:hypothetical protein